MKKLASKRRQALLSSVFSYPLPAVEKPTSTQIEAGQDPFTWPTINYSSKVTMKWPPADSIRWRLFHTAINITGL